MISAGARPRASRAAMSRIGGALTPVETHGSAALTCHTKRPVSAGAIDTKVLVPLFG
jgi:hypothetical protein